jgi:hypothetical protein
VRVFPGVLVRLVRLQGGARHHVSRRGRVQVGLEALAQGMELCAQQAQLACAARRGLALGHPAHQQHQRGGPLPGVRDDGPCQRRRIALAGPPAVGRKVAVVAAQAPFGGPTVWASQPIRGEVAFSPEGADAVVPQLCDREVKHHARIPHPARWLHMSLHRLSILRWLWGFQRGCQGSAPLGLSPSVVAELPNTQRAGPYL